MSGTDYVLGTHDEEIARLGLQHRAWRSRALAAWQKGEFGPGQTVLDVSAGVKIDRITPRKRRDAAE